MVNDLKKVPSQPIDNFEGFIDEQEGEDQAQGGNVIRGTRRIKFDNGKWFFADDETEIAADREFVAVGILRVVQKFVNGEPADKRSSWSRERNSPTSRRSTLSARKRNGANTTANLVDLGAGRALFFCSRSPH